MIRLSHRNIKPWVAGTAVSALLFGAFPLLPVNTVRAEDAPAAVYQISDELNVGVKSVLNEWTNDGVRVGVVLNLRNTGQRIVKLPSYEVKMTTDQGISYYLQASAANASVIRPQTKEELSFYYLLDSSDEMNIVSIQLLDVDWYVYPKAETLIADIPVQDVWRGSVAGFAEESRIQAWGSSFRLTALDSPLSYTPVTVTEDNLQSGPVTTVKVLVDNPGNKREKVPAFQLEGVSGLEGERKFYSGKRVEQGEVTLEPQEKKYIHYAISTEPGVKLDALNVLTSETFKSSDQAVSYSVGRLSVTLPSASAGGGSGSGEQSAAQVPLYISGASIAFDPLIRFVHPSLQVSLVELNLHENDDEGYQTAIAKFKLYNNSDLPVPVPAFAADLIGGAGAVYPGSRQSAAAVQVMPHTAYAVAYAFTVPLAENSAQFGVRLSEPLEGGAYKSALAQIRAEAGRSDESGTVNLKNTRLRLYPFEMKLNRWQLSYTANFANLIPVYAYKLELDVDLLRQEEVIVDSTFSSLQLELVDGLGRKLSSKSVPLTGKNKLISGKQIITFDSLKDDQLEGNLTVHVYETITTAAGEAKRLLYTLK
ncbi:hypothetical protein [Paenibacillus sp. y28]|uniref:hypothetical protein n=1 Tax=Paenibacillus sp. y28 TaxID=3129110 RepID=UPI0030194892